MFEKYEFCQKWGFENVNFAKNDILKMWILPKMRLWKWEFCEKWYFENVNFMKNEILKIWMLWKKLFGKCEFLDKLRIFAPVWVKEGEKKDQCTTLNFPGSKQTWCSVPFQEWCSKKQNLLSNFISRCMAIRTGKQGLQKTLSGRYTKVSW